MASATATRVPYVDIAGQHRPLKAELLAAVEAVLDSGQLVLGPPVQDFENRFAELCGTRFAVAVNSGTDALSLALRVLNVGPGDEVIVPPNSFVASASAVAMTGARPVFADVRDDYNLDPEAVRQALTPRTRAIMPVHLTGRPADMAPLMALAAERKLHIVEDCAQAVRAEYRGQRVGSFGALGCFSLHPLKTLNACGDGGVLTTSDATLAERLRILRNIGLRSREDCVEWSGNSRLDTIQAAMLLVKLRYLEAWTMARRAHAAFYQEALGDVPGVTVPRDRPHEFAVYHTFVIQAEQRDALKRYLSEQGVETSIHYPVPIHRLRAAAELEPGSYPVTERQAERILSLPVFPELTREQLQTVVDAIRAFYRTR
jgi:dTDP-4-amino-4,6-dideoxygalactose transaminase